MKPQTIQSPSRKRRLGAPVTRTAVVRRGTKSVLDGSVRLAESVYVAVKADLFEFRLAPGMRFSENEVSAALGVSRTPVREALNRLAQEGYIDVAAKSGWMVRPFDFALFEDLYEVRAILETAAIRRLCERDPMPELGALREIWLVAPDARVTDGLRLSGLDERFHAELVAAAGNPELARLHQAVTERIRIVRRLELASEARHAETYTEHAQILRNILRRRTDQAVLLLRAHIDGAKSAVRRITLHRLAVVRERAMARR